MNVAVKKAKLYCLTKFVLAFSSLNSVFRLLVSIVVKDRDRNAHKHAAYGKQRDKTGINGLVCKNRHGVSPWMIEVRTTIVCRPNGFLPGGVGGDHKDLAVRFRLKHRRNKEKMPNRSRKKVLLHAHKTVS